MLRQLNEFCVLEIVQYDAPGQPWFEQQTDKIEQFSTILEIG